MRVTVLKVLLLCALLGIFNRPEARAAGADAGINPTSGASGPEGTPVATSGRGAAAPEAAGSPAEREVTIPSGTVLAVTLDTPVGSDTSRVEEAVSAHISRSLRVQGRTVVAAGSRISGVVTSAVRSAKVKGRARIAMRFTTLTPSGDDQRYAIRTAAVARTARATKGRDAEKIGGGAAGGAIIGALVGGKKGALVGTAVGGGAGAAAVLATRGKEVHLGKGAPLTVRLTAPLTVRLRD